MIAPFQSETSKYFIVRTSNPHNHFVLVYAISPLDLINEKNAKQIYSSVIPFISDSIY